MKQNKKGIIDMLFFVIALFVLAILIISSYFILSETETKMNESGVIEDSELTILTDFKSDYVGITEFIFTASLFGIVIFVIVSSFFIRSHPALIMVGILALIIFGYFALILSGTWSEIVGTAQFAPYESQYTIIPYVMENFHYFVLALFTLVAIVFYGKKPDI